MIISFIFLTISIIGFNVTARKSIAITYLSSVPILYQAQEQLFHLVKQKKRTWCCLEKKANKML